MKLTTKAGHVEYDFEGDRLGKYVHIYNLYVYPNYRNKGEAKELIKLAIERIRMEGYEGEIQIVADPKEPVNGKLTNFIIMQGVVQIH